jgi:hypothetical protein
MGRLSAEWLRVGLTVLIVAGCAMALRRSQPQTLAMVSKARRAGERRLLQPYPPLCNVLDGSAPWGHSRRP